MIKADGPVIALHGEAIKLLAEFTCITKNLRDALIDNEEDLGKANAIMTHAFTSGLQYGYEEGVISNDDSGI